MQEATLWCSPLRTRAVPCPRLSLSGHPPHQHVVGAALHTALRNPLSTFSVKPKLYSPTRISNSMRRWVILATQLPSYTSPTTVLYDVIPLGIPQELSGFMKHDCSVKTRSQKELFQCGECLSKNVRPRSDFNCEFAVNICTYHMVIKIVCTLKYVIKHRLPEHYFLSSFTEVISAHTNTILRGSPTSVKNLCTNYFSCSAV